MTRTERLSWTSGTRDQFLREETGSLFIADIRRDNGDSRAVLLSKSIVRSHGGDTYDGASGVQGDVCIPAMQTHAVWYGESDIRG